MELALLIRLERGFFIHFFIVPHLPHGEATPNRTVCLLVFDHT